MCLYRGLPRVFGTGRRSGNHRGSNHEPLQKLLQGYRSDVSATLIECLKAGENARGRTFCARDHADGCLRGLAGLAAGAGDYTPAQSSEGLLIPSVLMAVVAPVGPRTSYPRIPSRCGPLYMSMDLV